MMIVRQFIKVINPMEVIRIIDDPGDGSKPFVLEGSIASDGSVIFEHTDDANWYEEVYSNFHVTNISVVSEILEPSKNTLTPIYQIKVR